MKKRTRPIVVGILAALILAAGGACWRFLSPSAQFAAGAAISFDDFDFTANSAKEVSPGTYEVEIQVRNSAKRVDFDFDPSVVRGFDKNGQPLKVGTLPASATLKPGQSVKRAFRMSGANGMDEITISFEFGGRIGAFLDTLIYGKREIRLPISR